MPTSSKTAKPMSPAALELSIVIVTHNVLAHLRRCLASIYAGDFAESYEVFVVDNGTDDSLAMVAAEFPDVKRVSWDRPTLVSRQATILPCPRHAVVTSSC